ncbi:uncharacterized protein [Rutidosis leptorrhynchoides]|uniref:uncharacterized protein n=1 Tax=Rutidosis leptorrhynchoides TaxID=125765 RepID=UPI003A99CC3A
MGNCASNHLSKHQQTLSLSNGPSSATKVIIISSIDGNLREFHQPIKTRQVLSRHPNNNFFLWSSEHMFVNHPVPHVPEDEDLQPSQIYFLMPVSKSCKPLSLHELCSLAIKASLAIEKNLKMKNGNTTSFSGRRKWNINPKVDFQLALKQLR